MDTSLDRANPSAIMKLLLTRMQIALKSWLKRWHGNDWMQGQDGWRKKASLIASCELAQGIFNGRRILYCAKHGLFCALVDFCDRCCLDKRIQPALDEYGSSFKLARSWYPMVINTRIRADEAGLTFGTLKSRPYAGQPDGHPLCACPEQEPYFERLCRALFVFPALLRDHGVIAGAYSHMEFHLSFWSGRSNYDFWSDLAHGLQPHLNVLFNTSAPITPQIAQAIYEALTWLLMRHHARLGYPNLWITDCGSGRLPAGYDILPEDRVVRRCVDFSLDVSGTGFRIIR